MSNEFSQRSENKNKINSGSEVQRKTKTFKKNQISNFINKTFKILENKQNVDIISWTDNGNSFIVKNKQKFEEMILPKYFKHRKFSSFVRQLNMYDFHKLRKEKQILIFRHKYFKMNKSDLLKKIKRKCVQENSQTLLKDKDGQPPSQQFNKIFEGSNYDTQNKDYLQSLAKQNQQLYLQIQNIQDQHLHLEEIKNRKKEKCVKIINSILFFDFSESVQQTELSSLRKLVNHYINDDEQAYKFEQYRQGLSKIFNNSKKMLELHE